MHILDLSIHILLVEDDEVDIQDIKRIFLKLPIPCMWLKMV